jgi:hypothetical protein
MPPAATLVTSVCVKTSVCVDFRLCLKTR